jgi:hypothetical protein
MTVPYSFFVSSARAKDNTERRETQRNERPRRVIMFKTSVIYFCRCCVYFRDGWRRESEVKLECLATLAVALLFLYPSHVIICHVAILGSSAVFELDSHGNCLRSRWSSSVLSHSGIDSIVFITCISRVRSWYDTDERLPHLRSGHWRVFWKFIRNHRDG